MKILIPTAKEMNTDLPSIEATPLRPESQAVLDALALYSASQLESFYKVSAEKAAEEFQNIQALKNKTAQHYPALKLFDGLMYRHIKRDKLTEVEQVYLENHVFITSALYGVVPALSPIAPHRLDFLMKLKIAGKTLKSHWKAAYDEAVKTEEVIFSLLSSEFETVFSKEIREKMVTFKFMEDKGGQLKIHSTISKKARGAFLTALIENQVQTVEEARRLSFAGFVYREDLSQPQELVFVKEVWKNILYWTIGIISHFILFENLFKLRQLRLVVGMVTDFVSSIHNLKTVFWADFVSSIHNLKTVFWADFVSSIYNLKAVLWAAYG